MVAVHLLLRVIPEKDGLVRSLKNPSNHVPLEPLSLIRHFSSSVTDETAPGNDKGALHPLKVSCQSSRPYIPYPTRVTQPRAF